MLHALLGDGRAVPGPVRLRLLAVMQGSAGQQALRPVLTPAGGRRQMPSAIAPLMPTLDLAIEEQVDALRAAGYTAPQAARLQHQVDYYLDALGGRQVAINKIEFPGGEVLLPLPGETRARELGTPAPVVTQAHTQVSGMPQSMAVSDCPRGDLCIFHGPFFIGARVNLWRCGYENSLRVIWDGIGSWDNNQIGYVYARFMNLHFETLRWSLHPRETDVWFSWHEVAWVQAC